MDVSSLMNAKMQAQAAQLQMAALRAVQETPGQERALSTLSQAIVQTQDAFAPFLGPLSGGGLEMSTPAVA
eukprot:gene13341-17894_t